jgi:hypothetical protein
MTALPGPGRSTNAQKEPRTRVFGGTRLSEVFGKYAIVGTYAPNGPSNFVRHVALLTSDSPIAAGTRAEVFHSGPPLVAGTESAERYPNARTTLPDLVADLDLTTSEYEAIENWLAGVETENRIESESALPFQQYTIIPHMNWHTAPETGRRIRRRFSCCGFVFEAYLAADIILLDQLAMPEAAEDLLNAAYPDLLRVEESQPLARKLGFAGRGDLGITTDGPWRVMLPGYLFHATARSTKENRRPAPYVPADASESCYPKNG